MSVFFFNKNSPLLIDALNRPYQAGELSTSQCQALITVIEKKKRTKDI